jgi:ribonuclease D
VTSLATHEKDVVIRCLNETREPAINYMKETLESSRILKVFCGATNDIGRMQKDWACFPVGLVDIQFMFSIWVWEDFEHCFRTCEKLVADRVSKLKSSPDPRQYLRNDMKTPGLDFFMKMIKCGNVKDTSSTNADWRPMVLQRRLIEYAASDCYHTLRVFYFLYEKVLFFN